MAAAVGFSPKENPVVADAAGAAAVVVVVAAAGVDVLLPNRPPPPPRENPLGFPPPPPSKVKVYSGYSVKRNLLAPRKVSIFSVCLFSYKERITRLGSRRSSVLFRLSVPSFINSPLRFYNTLSKFIHFYRFLKS